MSVVSDANRQPSMNSLTFFSLVLCMLAPVQEPDVREIAQENLAFAAAQYSTLLEHVPENKFPRTFEQGKLKLVDSADWTSGFFPGSLWYLYEHTGDPKWREQAGRCTGWLEKEKDNKTTHDLGFMIHCSYGNGYRLLRNPAYRTVILTAADSLSSRFNPAIGCIRSWDFGRWNFPVIIDNMMNLEMLLWAAQESGSAEFAAIARAHADTTMRHHFRADAGSYHLVNFANDGAVIGKQTVQGAANESAWARGQGWGLYGFTTLYRLTEDERYLAQANRIAAFILHHPRLPADKVPYWDFDAPDIPNAKRDASAAALICSALIELSGYVTPELRSEYLAAAGTMLRSLSSARYRAQLGENGGFVLMHSVGHYRSSINSEIDVPLNYADYYFIEACMRWLAKDKSRFCNTGSTKRLSR